MNVIMKQLLSMMLALILALAVLGPCFAPVQGSSASIVTAVSQLPEQADSNRLTKPIRISEPPVR